MRTAWRCPVLTPWPSRELGILGTCRAFMSPPAAAGACMLHDARDEHVGDVAGGHERASIHGIRWSRCRRHARRVTAWCSRCRRSTGRLVPSTALVDQPAGAGPSSRPPVNTPMRVHEAACRAKRRRHAATAAPSAARASARSVRGGSRRASTSTSSSWARSMPRWRSYSTCPSVARRSHRRTVLAGRRKSRAMRRYRCP
jgi:hypothetical protein